MTTPMSDADRAAFEAWFWRQPDSQGFLPDQHAPLADGTYDWAWKQGQWEAWQAALACAREEMAESKIPEGCTPADAQMLRTANHQLAQENDELRKALAPFAELVGSDEFSWAMVEYRVKNDPEKQTFSRPQMQRSFNRAARVLGNFAMPKMPAQHGLDPEITRMVDKEFWNLTGGNAPPQSNGLTDAEAKLSGVLLDLIDVAIKYNKGPHGPASSVRWDAVYFVIMRARALIAALQPTAEPGKDGE